MYKIIYIISYVLRMVYCPNPFEYLPNGEALNLLFGGILIPITYFMVGTFYQKGSAPVIGSIAFLAMYFVNGFVFKQIMRLYPTWWLIIIATVGYIIVFIYIVNKIVFSD